MSEENEDITGYITAGKYAEQENMQDEEVIKQIKTGLLPGRLINNLWYVDLLDVPNSAAIEASEKAQNEYKKSVKPVQVVGLEIPFGDVMWLTVQGACASLIIAIPIGLLLVVINS